MSTHRGIVLRAHSGQYAVWDEDGVASCKARRRLDRPDGDHPEYPVPGDEVGWKLLQERGAERDGVIEIVYPRHTEISRNRSGTKHVIVANLDRLVLVAAVREPPLDRALLDRLLAASERHHIEGLVCLTKIDLDDGTNVGALRRLYESVGYPVIPTSAVTGEGIDILREALRGHRAALMGASGAGKSRLIGLLQPGLEVRTGEVSEKSGHGRHTTTRVDLHRTDFGALLADTPGVRDFNLWKLDPTSLGGLYRDFHSLQGDCRYAGCTHVPEPECAVKEALATGAIDAGRYASYRALLADLQETASGNLDREGRSRRGRNG
jgi:ribosome biogenesis GTPase